MWDSDADRIDDQTECAGQLPCPDSDGDGKPNHLDIDSDGDGIIDWIEGYATARSEYVRTPSVFMLSVDTVDTDGDGWADYLDVDSDGDTVGDEVEAFDFDGDGGADVTASGVDTDGDGLDDAYDLLNTEETTVENAMAGLSPPPNRHGGLSNWRNPDDDGDGIPTVAELKDSDDNGIPDYLEHHTVANRIYLPVIYHQ